MSRYEGDASDVCVRCGQVEPCAYDHDDVDGLRLDLLDYVEVTGVPTADGIALVKTKEWHKDDAGDHPCRLCGRDGYRQVGDSGQLVWYCRRCVEARWPDTSR